MSGLFPPPADLPADRSLEYEAWSAGHDLVAGVDEAGRGPLAGPVVAAAVILPHQVDLTGVTDSKALTPARRDELAELIRERALAVGLGAAGAGEIDRVNILQATFLAMSRAVAQLDPRPDFLLIDGNQVIGRLDLAQRAVVKGDSLSLAIAAASIIAKTARDRMMARLDAVFPGYGFARHKGYAAKEHYRALAEQGPCWAHRRTFRGVKELAHKFHENGR